MRWLLLILSYLPSILKTVVAVEEVAKGLPGQSRKQIVLDIISTGAKGAEEIPEEHVKVIGTLIDTVVSALNKSGLFSKSKPAIQ